MVRTLFVLNALLTFVTPAMMVAREETFVPVAPLFRFKTDEEAIAMANDARDRSTGSRNSSRSIPLLRGI